MLDNAPYEVLDAHIFRLPHRKPQNKTKLKNLITGSMTEITFHASDKVDEAEIGRRSIKYLYTNKGESWFAEEGNPKNRFAFPDDVVHDKVMWLKQNSPVEVLLYNDNPHLCLDHDNAEQLIIDFRERDLRGYGDGPLLRRNKHDTRGGDDRLYRWLHRWLRWLHRCRSIK